MYDRLCLFGAGGHGRVVAAQIRLRHSDIEVFFGDATRPVGTIVGDIPVAVQSPTELQDVALIVTIGDNAARARTQFEAVEVGVTLGHFVADADRYFAPPPGSGTMVLAGAIVTSDAHIGAGVIVNSGAIVEHDCEIGDFCHLAPGCVLAGGATLGTGVFVGAGARVVNRSRVASDAVIGAGATVVADINEAGTYVGTPARRIGPPQNG